MNGEFNLRVRVTLETKKRRWTLSAYARKIGRTPQAMNDILNRGNPSLALLKEMADGFGMTIEDFVTPVSAKAYGEIMMEAARDEKRVHEVSGQT